MKTYKWVSSGAAALFLVLGLAGPIGVFAAGTAPTLGAADSYAVFGSAAVTNNTVGGTPTHIWGNVGSDISVTGLTADQVDGTIDAGSGVAGAAATAYGVLAGQVAPGAPLPLSGTHTVVPGVYNIQAAPLNGEITLNGEGVYIFKSTSSIDVQTGTKVLLTNGASACDVFWQVPTAMTITGGDAEMVGTIITDTAEITLAAGASLKGRALAHTGVTMIDNQITNPCAAVPVPVGSRVGTINVVKLVINDNGGTKTVADFPLFVNGTPVASGVTNNFRAPADAYAITETSDSRYARTFSGDCDVDGRVAIIPGDNKFCVVTNDDIGAPVVVPPVPPLIDVVKVPNPLALPTGPGSVEYTYTLRNIGTVPVTDLTMVGDTCSPINLVSGDSNADAKLDVSETWVYRCSTTLTETHTNNIVATGWANGLTATDIASATVVVGVPLVPPIIHITKVPNPLTLLAGGGAVTYTKTVTNPGTVALSNVRVTDDKCGPITLISGDVNGDAKLDPTETWVYTCRTNLTQTTTNTAVATGEASGMTARDLAIATVVVAASVPALPKTGFDQAGSVPVWPFVAAGVLAISLLLLVIRKKQTA
jgi:hypothetical protein